jgi:hypothetical protein
MGTVMANPILSGAIDTLRNRQVQGDPYSAFSNTQRAIGDEKLKRLRSQGYDSSDPEATRLFREEEMKILGGYDPEQANKLQLSMNKGQTSTKWDRQKEAMGSPEAKAIMEEFNRVLAGITTKRKADPSFDAGGDIAKLSGLEQQYRQITGVNLRTMLSRQTLRNLNQTKQKLEKDDDDAYASYKTIIDQTIPEMNQSIKLARVSTDALNSALGLMQAKWDPEKEEFIGDASASDIQTAIKAFVRSIDNSVVMQGEIERVVGSNLLETVMAYPNKWQKREPYSKEQSEMIFKTMVKSASLKDDLLKRVIKGTQDEALAKVDTIEGWRITPEQAQKIREEIGAMGDARYDKLEILPQGQKPVGIFTDVVEDFNNNGSDSPPSNTGKPVRADYPSLAEYATALKKWKANGE